MRISDWSSDVCSSDLLASPAGAVAVSVAGAVAVVAGAGVAVVVAAGASAGAAAGVCACAAPMVRSEERRVGNEGVSTSRSRVSPDHYIKKTRQHIRVKTPINSNNSYKPK